ncbi:something about silencing protein 10 isoform X1 [Scomber scombrus]|uniref:something about silencing protein 10 isoform X1 n=1 Tax=Scomber scombrus TaxID=13677 RepID=UPI002DDC8E48|nr:something about silencing protein 10 isoform X1 [Scomber scombrus]
MVRAKRGKQIQRPKRSERYDENDEEAYKNMPVPDKKSLKYTKDKIDEFHDEKIAKLLASGVQMESDPEELDDEEEVMPLDDSESEENEEEEADMESDLEGQKDEELPNEMAWGTKKKMFYDSDYVTSKGKSKEDLEAEEQEEEEEAKNIQKRLAENLSEEDYDLNFFQDLAVEEKDEKKTAKKEERIVKDLKQMSQKEKLKLLKKESPELLELIQDFKTKLAEMKNELQPLVQMVKDGKIQPGKQVLGEGEGREKVVRGDISSLPHEGLHQPHNNIFAHTLSCWSGWISAEGADYLKTKQQLYLNYCTNISFYLVLKAKRIPVHNHPVIERLLTYRNLINELGAVDARLAPQFRKLLAGEGKDKATSRPAEGKKVGVSSKKDMDSGETVPEIEEDSDSELDEEAALQFYRGVEARLKLKRKTNDPEAEGLEEHEDEKEEFDPDAKRGITYQMAKNKGLTPKRKKIDRNPRVKHREKFRRAKIRRKGQVRDVRREDKRYSGEMSGIRAGVKKSVKLK